jgi:hypothetical protein
MIRLFSMGVYQPVVEDVTYMIRSLYPYAIEIVDWPLSQCAPIFDKEVKSTDVITRHTWDAIDLTMIERFKAKYSTFLRQFDGFLVTHTPIFALLYETFNKPIIVVNSGKYNIPLSTESSWFVNRLRSLSLRNNVMFISTNKTEQAYLKNGTGIDSILIPSLCLYTNASYNPIYDEVISYREAMRKFGGLYRWEELYRYKAIIHYPEESSAIAIAEQYSANVPLLIPTKDEPYDESMSHIIYFENPDHLARLISTLDYADVSYQMKLQNKERQAKALLDWRDVIQHIFPDIEMENRCHYVGSIGIRKSCSVYTSYDGPDIAIYDFSSLRDGDTVYVHNNALLSFSKIVSTIERQIILVSGCCDHTIPDDVFPSLTDFLALLSNDKIIRWYAQNCVYIHEKLVKLPIGMDYHTMYNNSNHEWGSRKTPHAQEVELMEIRTKSVPFHEREVKIYSNCQFLMWTRYGYQRLEAIQTIPTHLLVLEASKVDRVTTWTNQSRYAFVLSPHGNGLDCHRTWEALNLGCIPIVKTSAIDDLYTDLPVLIVNTWSEVDDDLLTTTVERFRSKTFAYEKLTMSYWTTQINRV